MSDATTIAQKGRWGCGKPPAIPTPCSCCGNVTTGHRRGMCANCYQTMLYHKRHGDVADGKIVNPDDNLDLQEYVWKHQLNMSIGAICARKGCTPQEVRDALVVGLMAIHRKKEDERNEDTCGV